MHQKVLFVDDDPKVLNGIRRQFEDAFPLVTTERPERGLEILGDEGPFAVVVSDMRMPGLTGTQFLARVKEVSADTVRIMLTGYADLQTTIDAVNEGNIFRFLSKPCAHEVLQKAVRDGLEQHRLVTAERELLNGTLHGSIKVLSEVLSLVNPLAFGRTSQVQRIALAIGEQMQMPNLWDLKIAAMLFPLGCVTVSEATLECVLTRRPTPRQERNVFAQHAAVARNMLEKIPRLESVASIVAYQDKHFDGTGNPPDKVSGDQIPLGARILKAACDFEIAFKCSDETGRALQQLDANSQAYDPNVLHALGKAIRNGLCQSSKKQVRINQLRKGMVLASDVRTPSGHLMVSSGQEVTDSIRRRLRDLCEQGTISSDFQVESLGDVQPAELANVDS